VSEGLSSGTRTTLLGRELEAIGNTVHPALCRPGRSTLSGSSPHHDGSRGEINCPDPQFEPA